MKTQIDIIAVERIEGCGILVTFSDGTVAAYITEELRALRPYRESADGTVLHGCSEAFN
jgi:hypothetical protein